MSTLPVIEVRGLTKRYSRRANQHRGLALRDLLREAVGRPRPAKDLREDEFLAVDGLSFDVHSGEAIALIGRNGCGKTTTMKMLAGLIRPDSGEVVVRGRVQSLISLGTGFKLSLTGAENIIAGAAVQGFNTTEAKAIMAAVVEFAELEEFIDSPFSTYSSGMKARLGFSLAVHMRPDVMLIDEILGVGDFAFQNKCFTCMNELQKQGVTIVLVSHQLNRIVQMCERAVWLHKGSPRVIADAETATRAYLDYVTEKTPPAAPVHEPGHRTPSVDNSDLAQAGNWRRLESHPRVHHVHVDIVHAEDASLPLTVHAPVRISVTGQLADHVDVLSINLPIYREADGLHLTKLSTGEAGSLRDVHDGAFNLNIDIPDLNLAYGRYVMFVAIFDGHAFIYRDHAVSFEVLPGNQIYFPNNLLDLSNKQTLESTSSHTGQTT